mgnify:CR=1 FL=1
MGGGPAWGEAEGEKVCIQIVKRLQHRGVDVGAIEFVWRQILDQKEEGRAVLLISAELDEIYALSDRIVTIYEGRITGEFAPDAPPEEIGLGMLGRTDTPEAS